MGFGLGVHREYNLKELQQQQECNALLDSTSFSQTSFYSDTYCLTSDNTLLAHEGEQVVPSFQRRGVFRGHQREAKPLSLLPDPEELMSDEAANSEVEFFTRDRQHLLPKSFLTTINRDCGQVNYAYQAAAAGIGSVTFSWPSRADRSTGRGGWYGGNNWSFTFQREDHVEDGSGDKDPDKQPSFRMLFSSTTAWPSDKPDIPPRIPIPPKPPANTKEEDKPPKIPPRVPLVPPRTLSPKNLPIYINGVMPATQSFAANPKYVSKALQRQQCERTPALAQVSPCIVPILKDGRQASNTHYILLPLGRPTHTDRREWIRGEPGRTGSGGVRQRK